jgi:hypothetical protein
MHIDSSLVSMTRTLSRESYNGGTRIYNSHFSADTSHVVPGVHILIVAVVVPGVIAGVARRARTHAAARYSLVAKK